jgi:putative transposase
METLSPFIVPKHQRRIAEIDEKILAMYARGLSTRDISAQLEELYGAKVSIKRVAMHFKSMPV